MYVIQRSPPGGVPPCGRGRCTASRLPKNWRAADEESHRWNHHEWGKPRDQGPGGSITCADLAKIGIPVAIKTSGITKHAAPVSTRVTQPRLDLFSETGSHSIPSCPYKHSATYLKVTSPKNIHQSPKKSKISMIPTNVKFELFSPRPNHLPPFRSKIPWKP
jgi:hypothetical protein